MTTKSKLGLFTGLFLFVLMLIVPQPEGLSSAGWLTAAVGALMATWWITEAIPIPATSLLPIVLFPLLQIQSISATTAPYANPLIFLFMGGFMIAIAMQKWDLHKRIALNIVNFSGTKPTSIIIGFILASAFLSMWVSNTATALMMLPIALSIIAIAAKNRKTSSDGKPVKSNFELVLVLGIAYGCNIGGVATLIGTPPNALLAGFALEAYGLEVGFARWMLAGLPIVLVGLPVMYLVLTRFIYPIKLKDLPGGSEFISSELENLGSMSNQEKKVAAVFIVTALLWMFRLVLENIIPGLSDAGIAIAAGVALFIIPSGRVDEKAGILQWGDMRQLPWGILILFGGGLSLASAITATGLAEWIALQTSGFDALPLLLILLIIVAIVVFLTEITSNTATAAAFVPILAAVAIGLGQNPLLFAIPTAIAASCAFMLPVATPPNAVVYSSNEVTMFEMSKAGLWLNLIFIALISVAAYTIIAWNFGIELGTIPGWVD